MIRAIRDNVIVRPLKPDGKTGSIHIPDQFQKTQLFGHVISVGSEVKSVKPNAFVFFTIHGGKRFLHNEQEYISFKESEIYAEITDPNKSI